jgi:hypothetical protein
MTRPGHLLFALTVLAIVPAACSDDNNDNGIDASVFLDAAAGGSGGGGGTAGSGGTGTGGVAGADASVGDATAGAAGTTDAGDAAATDGGADAADAGPPATFTQVYTQVIAVRCTPCHTTATGIGVVNGKLDMTSQAAAFTNLVNTPAAGVACNAKGPRVMPGDPDMSVMYLKISLDDPTPCGGKMPLNQAALTQDQADMIESWITAGAPNN